MAVTTQYGEEYTDAYVDAPPSKLAPHQNHGRVRIAFFTHAQDGAGEATSSVAIAQLPPGKVRLLGKSSVAYVNWTTASATIDVGWDAYYDADGDAVAADPDGIDNGVSVETAGAINLGSALAATGYTKVFESCGGVTIRATSQDTAIISGDDLVGYLMYVVD